MLQLRKLVLLALLLSEPAFAANWLKVSETTSGSEMYVDTASVVSSGSGRTYWVRTDAIKDRTVSYRTAKAQWREDCVANTTTLLSYVLYDANGTVSSSETLDYSSQKAKPIVPDTIGESIHNTVCGL
jgi:hypothetical protein